MISNISFAHVGSLRKKRHRAFQQAVFTETAPFEVPEYDDISAPLAMWAVTATAPGAGRRAIRTIGDVMYEPVLLPRTEDDEHEDAHDVFDGKSQPAGRSRWRPAAASNPGSGIVFAYRIDKKGIGHAGMRLSNDMDGFAKTVQRAEHVADVGEIDPYDSQKAVTSIQDAISADFASIDGVLFRRTRPSIVCCSGDTLSVQPLGFHNYAGGLPLFRPFDMSICRPQLVLGNIPMDIADIVAIPVGPGAAIGDETGIVLAGAKAIIVAMLNGELADPDDAPDPASASLLLELKAEISSLADEDLPSFVDRTARRTGTDLARFDNLKSMLDAAEAAFRWLEIGRLDALPRIVGHGLDDLRLVVGSTLQATREGETGWIRPQLAIAKRFRIDAVSASDHPVVATFPNEGYNKHQRVDVRYNEGRFYAPTFMGVSVEPHRISMGWDKYVAPLLLRDLEAVSGIASTFHSVGKPHYNADHPSIPFASVRAAMRDQIAGLEDLPKRLISIDGVVHREIPEPRIALFSSEDMPQAALGYAGYLGGGHVFTLCYSLREIPMMKASPIGIQAARWEVTLNAIQVLDPSVFSPDMKSLRADLVGRRLARRLADRISELEPADVMALSRLRTMIAPKGRHDLAEAVDPEAVLSILDEVGHLFSYIRDMEVRQRLVDDLTIIDAETILNPGQTRVVPVDDGDEVIAMGI